MSDTWSLGKLCVGDRVHFMGHVWFVAPGGKLLPLPKPKPKEPR